MTDTVDHIAAAAQDVQTAVDNLIDLLLAECAGPHEFVQHRGRHGGPWCQVCRRTPAGELIPYPLRRSPR